MDNVLAGCSRFAALYIYDILMLSKYWSPYLIHINKVLEALDKAGITAKPTKCDWVRQYINYLGHLVGSG